MQQPNEESHEEKGSQCPICQVVGDSINNLQARYHPGHNDHLNIAPLDKFRQAKQCSTCTSMCARFVELTESRFGVIETDIYERMVVIETCNGGFEFWLDNHKYYLDSANITRSSAVGPLDSLERPRGLSFPTLTLNSWHPERDFAATLDPHWIDASRLLRWINFCEKTHRGLCFDLPKWQVVTSASDLILIDIERQCLVQRDPPPQYCALSYVWGTQPSLTTTCSNFENLCESGSLETVAINSCIPRTILDAMQLTKSLNIGYLWVDRLCIIQDDDGSKSRSISAMTSIYANAHVTILASSGADAEYGLPGVSPTPRNHMRSIFEFTTNCKLVEVPRNHSRGERYYQRGWTFQEELLSRRTLTFENDTVYWNCQGMAREEEVECESPENRDGHEYSPPPRRWPIDIPASRSPRLSLFARLVEEYASRELSYLDDKLAAFSGVLGALSSRFAGGFFYGLPEDFLDLALLWEGSDEARRIFLGPDGTLYHPRLPSWSWAGWLSDGTSLVACSVTPGYLIGDVEEKHPKIYGLRIHSLVDWYKKPLDSNSLYRISNSFYEWRQVSEDPLAELPKGWHRKLREVVDELDNTLEASDRSTSETAPSSAFWHDSDPDSDYRSVVHLVNDDHRAEADQEWEPFLYFSTHLSHHVITDTFLAFDRFARGFCQYLVIRDDQKKMIGMLRCCADYYVDHESNNDIPLDDFDISPTKSVEKEWYVALIVISRMTLARKDFGQIPLFVFPELKIPEFLDAEDDYDFYNVLCVEWQDGIAYRRGIGRIQRQAWDQGGSEEIDIILG